MAAILCAVFATAGRSVREREDKTGEAGLKVDGCIKRLNCLKCSPSCGRFSEILDRMAENPRFADHSSIVRSDREIEHAVSSLKLEFMRGKEELSEKVIEKLYVSLNSLIAGRDQGIKAVKKGGI